MNKRASQNKPELWIEEDRRLFYADAITIKSTGECFKVEDKLAKIHTYMVDQYNSYQADGKSFYEDQRDIATKCKCTPKTLGKWLKVLQALGLLIIDESQKSHSYTVRSVVSQEHNLIFSYPKLLNGKPSYDHEETLKRLYASQGRRNVKIISQKPKRAVRVSRNVMWNLSWWDLPRLLLENQTAYLLWIFLSMLIYPVVMIHH